MNIVKKIITIILASAIIISCAAVTFADNISANDKIEQLIENGFPKSFFKLMKYTIFSQLRAVSA